MVAKNDALIMLIYKLNFFFKAKRLLNIIRVVASKKWGGDWKTLKKTVQYVGKRWTMAVNYIMQLLQED